SLEPIVFAGFEAFEFLSKTDRFDQYGNPYFYWSDGTLRNQAETRENLNTAIEITRDYQYETDIRTASYEQYTERSFAIPFGVGFNLLLNSRMSYQMGLEYHWTFTDHIDGVTLESRPESGNKQTDKFMHTFMRFTFNLTPTPHEEGPDFSGGDNADTDQDSIPDFEDLCPETPLGVEVDLVGCPLDSDGDGVPDYVDAELNSPEGSIVDSNGIAMTDADFEQMYLEYTDKSGKYSTYTNTARSLETAERKTIRPKAKFTVKIGEFEEGVNDSLANVLLSMPDVTTRQTEDGKTIIEVGNFESLPEAMQRRMELEKGGVLTQDVMETGTSGESSRVTTIEQTQALPASLGGITVEEALENNRTLPPPSELILNRDQYTLNRPIDERSVAKANDDMFGGESLYRIQVGAFANKLADDIFDDVNDLIVITTSDGLTRYYTGAFSSYEQAASRKIDMLEKGFDGSHVIPFKNGNRNLMSQSGATPADNVVPITPNSSTNYGKVKFKVQIGAYSEGIPTDMLDKMMGLGRIDQREVDGVTRYFVGEFNNYVEAESFKDQLISEGFDGAFIGAEYDGRIISAEDGIELLK
ncbi:MAG: SPOR domain-containing protein, partial [Flavobacteriales bacterium]|nr:SPOR domain-containing protein [Flavobacteriales bacterium]